VLDTYVSKPTFFSRKIAKKEVEAAICLTASIADALFRKGTTLEFFAAGADLFYFQAADAPQSSLESMLEILAACESTQVNPFEKLSPAIGEALESISVVVCIFVDWDESREELVNQIIQSGCSLRVLLTRSRSTEQPFPVDNDYTQLDPREVLEGGICSL